VNHPNKNGKPSAEFRSDCVAPGSFWMSDSWLAAIQAAGKNTPAPHVIIREEEVIIPQVTPPPAPDSARLEES
jgi:hypothetical protein